MLQPITNAGILTKTDWNRVRSMLDIAWQEIEQGHWNHRKQFYHTDGDSQCYSLEKNGGIVCARLKDNTWWKFWTGKWFESLLPWSKPLRQYMNDQGLPISTITYHAHTNTIYAHRDVSYQNADPDLPHTNINLLISTTNPAQNFTWVKDHYGNEVRYFGRANSAYFFNAGNFHGVESTGFRDGVIIKLLEPFEKVKTFIDLHPDFLDENQNYFKS